MPVLQPERLPRFPQRREIPDRLGAIALGRRSPTNAGVAVEISLQDLTDLVGGKLIRNGSCETLRGFESLDKARPDEISFFGNERYAKQLAATSAGAVFVPRAAVEAPEATALIEVDNPVTAFDLVIREFASPKPAFEPGIHPTAAVAEDVAIDPQQVSVGANAVIESGASVGNGTRIGSGAVIEQGAKVGEDCEIHANAIVNYGCLLGDRVILHSCAVIGADGYGFQLVEGRHQKIEQLGIVRIEDDVEVGANTCIDRARFGETVIGEGTKIDNLVQIGHNCIVGKHCLIVSQTGLSGSARIGDYVTLAAKSGVGGHIEIGDRAVVGGAAGCISDVPAGQTVFGYPAKPMKEELRTKMFLKRLPGLFDRVKKLEKDRPE